MNVHHLRYFVLYLLIFLLLGCAPTAEAPTPTALPTKAPAVTPVSDVGELGALLEQEEGGTFAGLWIERSKRFYASIASPQRSVYGSLAHW